MKRYSQQDPLWKNKTLGNGDVTIGKFGCFLTDFAMLAEIDPLTLNDALLEIGFGDPSRGQGSYIIPSCVPLVSRVRIGNPINCQTIPAPLNVIDDALASGHYVIAGIDTSPDPDIQWHYVILTGKVGDDYNMVDPWPLVDNPTPTLLQRYGKGRDAKTIITYILAISQPLRNDTTCNDVVTPVDAENAGKWQPAANQGILQVVTDGLRIRNEPSTDDDNPPIGILYRNAKLKPTGEIVGNWRKVEGWVNDGEGEFVKCIQ